MASGYFDDTGAPLPRLIQDRPTTGTTERQIFLDRLKELKREAIDNSERLDAEISTFFMGQADAFRIAMNIFRDIHGS